MNFGVYARALAVALPIISFGCSGNGSKDHDFTQEEYLKFQKKENKLISQTSRQHKEGLEKKIAEVSPGSFLLNRAISLEYAQNVSKQEEEFQFPGVSDLKKHSSSAKRTVNQYIYPIRMTHIDIRKAEFCILEDKRNNAHFSFSVNGDGEVMLNLDAQNGQDAFNLFAPVLSIGEEFVNPSNYQFLNFQNVLNK
jgi:hypothetical protein